MYAYVDVSITTTYKKVNPTLRKLFLNGFAIAYDYRIVFYIDY